MNRRNAEKLTFGELVEVELDGGKWEADRVTSVDSDPVTKEVNIRVQGQPNDVFTHTRVRLPK